MKIIDIISKTNIPTACLIAVVARATIFGASIGDALVVLALAGLFGYVKFLNKTDQTWMKAVLDEMKMLKDSMTSIKMGQGLRKVNEKPTEKGQRVW